MRRKFKGFNRLSSGTYGVSHRYPRLLLESMRFYKKYQEKKWFREMLSKKGDISASKVRSGFLTDFLGRTEENLQPFKRMANSHKQTMNPEYFDKYFSDIKNYLYTIRKRV